MNDNFFEVKEAEAEIFEFTEDSLPNKAIKELMKRVSEAPPVDGTKLSLYRQASYLDYVDGSITDMVVHDYQSVFGPEHLKKIEAIREDINIKKAHLLDYFIKLAGQCTACGDKLQKNGSCDVCVGEDMVKNATSPLLQFYEDGFIVSLATEIANFVVTSGFSHNDAISIAKDRFTLDQREEYRLRKYLERMGHITPQMVWLSPSESRIS